MLKIKKEMKYILKNVIEQLFVAHKCKFFMCLNKIAANVKKKYYLPGCLSLVNTHSLLVDNSLL